MTKDSEEYKQLKEKHDDDQEYRERHPKEYPWFAYYQYGFHRMTYLTDEEVAEEVKFYKLKSDGKGGYFRFGRQPITIMPRK